jgi:hypothetical protein
VICLVRPAAVMVVMTGSIAGTASGARRQVTQCTCSSRQWVNTCG